MARWMWQNGGCQRSNKIVIFWSVEDPLYDMIRGYKHDCAPYSLVWWIALAIVMSGVDGSQGRQKPLLWELFG
jgi:hypothetical protein